MIHINSTLLQIILVNVLKSKIKLRHTYIELNFIPLEAARISPSADSIV